MLNCKPDDLAVIVRTAPRNAHLIGRIARVTSLDPMSSTADPSWFYEEPVLIGGGKIPIRSLEDDCLRPLRDSDGTDETIVAAGKPQESVREALEAIVRDLDYLT